MNPHDDQLGRRVGAPISSQPRPITPPPRDYSGSQAAAANVIRDQINAIYGGRSTESTPHTTPVVQPRPAEHANPETTERTTVTPPPRTPSPHALNTAPPTAQPAQPAAAPTPAQSTAEQPLQPQPAGGSTDKPAATLPNTQPQPVTQAKPPAHQPQITADQWKQYHSSWQKYYQMYYERYYASHLDQKQQEFDRLVQSARDTNTGTTPATTDTVSAQNPIKRLRAQIQQTVRDKAKKVTKSRHFIPALAGVLVLLAFVFLQYNRVLFGMAAAYTTPGNIDPQNIIVNPSSDASVGPDPRLIIPKLNVDVPIIYGVNAADHNAQMKAMEKGAAHFSIAGANAVPGQIGNAVFSAHSSNDAFAPGDYKFVFAQNEKLVKDDIMYMHYQGKRYTYAVTKKEVVMPNEVSRVQIQTDKPMLTLISCVPLGTAEKRLLVFAEQISPDPSGATKSTEPVSTQSAAIPGKPSPTLLERLFGAKD